MSRVLFSDTITLYQKNGDIYERVVINGVQWRQRIDRVSDSGKLSMTTSTSVTLPDGVSDEIKPGDVIVPGVGPEITDAYSIAALRADYGGYCTVQAVADNRNRPKLRHRRVTAV